MENNRKSFESENDDTQTELDRTIFCYECDFPAEDYRNFAEHMMEFHAFVFDIFDDQEGLDEHEPKHNEETKNNSNSNLKKLACHYCRENFDTQDSVMKHRKRALTNKVAQFTLFSAGNCFYGDGLCWFDHNNQAKTTSDFICYICNNTFKHDLLFCII